MDEITVFMCPSINHKCNEDAAFLILRNNDVVEDTSENREKFKAENFGWTVACSICGKTAFEESAFI